MIKSKFFTALIVFCLIFIVLTIFSTILLFQADKINFLYANVIVVGIFIFSGLAVYFSVIKRKIYCRIFFIISLVFTFGIFIYAISIKYDLIRLFTNATNIKNFILQQGGWGVMALIVIQISQCVAVPIPSIIIVFVGTLIYGPALCALFCSIGILIGSYISFGIGKVFGRKVVAWIIGKDKLEYYSNLVQGREKLFLIAAFILPFFPDDLLCLTAGITKMTFKEFFFVALLTRPIGMIFLCYFGGSIFDIKNNYMFFLMLILFAIVIIGVFLLFFKKQRAYLFSESKKLIESFAIKKKFINKR